MSSIKNLESNISKTCHCPTQHLSHTTYQYTAIPIAPKIAAKKKVHL